MGEARSRIFKTKGFARFQRKEKIGDETLVEAILRAERGLIDADLGSRLIKQRVARPGQGRSGGYRTIIAYRVGSRAVLVFGFAKNEKDSISAADERDLADYGTLLLDLDDAGIEAAITGEELTEIEYDDEA